MTVRDTILTINIVEPGLVNAINRHAKEMNRDLKGVVLIDHGYAAEALERDFPRDKTGLFQEVFCNLNDPDDIQKALMPYTDRLLAATCRYENSMYSYRNVIPFIPYVLTPSESSLLWSLEKPLMRDRLSKYDSNLVPKYQYMEACDMPNMKNLLQDFSFPVIVKPSSLAESLLVTECKDEQSLKSCLENTFRLIGEIYSREHRTTKPSVLVEEMMQGDMYSTDAYVTSEGEIFCMPLVKVITAHSIGLPGFYSYRHIIPVGLTDHEINAAFDAARGSVRALNLRSTSTHIELFYTPQGWKIIEVGARIGGYRAALYSEAYGSDHFYNDLAIHLGQKPIMPGEPLQHAAGFNIYAEDEGIIESIMGIAESSKLESVVSIESHAESGDHARFASNGGRYVVDGILSNKDPQKLEEDMTKIRELVVINIESKQSSNAHDKKRRTALVH